MTSEQAVTALTIGGSMTFGLVLALLGHLKLTLAQRPERGADRIDLLLTLLNLALVPLMIAAGLLVDFWGIRQTIILGSILLSLAFLALSAGAAYWRTLFAVIVAAFGAATVGTASLILMPKGLFGPDETTASLALGLIFVSLGALLVPPTVDLLVRGIGFGRTMAVMALLVLAPAVLAALPQSIAFQREPPASYAELPVLLQTTSLWLAGLVFFCYAPLEGFVSVWVQALLRSIGQPHKQVRWLLAFWGAFLGSRLFVAIVEHAGYLHDEWSGWFLVGYALLAGVTIGNLAGAVRPQHAGKGLVVLGFFMGPLLPLLAGMLFRMNHADALTGTAFGLLFGCGALGSMALAPLVGSSAREANIQIALRIPLIIVAFLSASTLLFVLVSGD